MPNDELLTPETMAELQIVWDRTEKELAAILSQTKWKLSLKFENKISSTERWEAQSDPWW